MNLDATTCNPTEPTTDDLLQETTTPDSQMNAAVALESGARQHGPRLEGIVIGRLTGYDTVGNPLIDYVANATRYSLVARIVGACGRIAPGSQVAIMFEQGEPSLPLVLGPIVESQSIAPETECPDAKEQPFEVTVDKKRLVFEADQEIVLRCGASSITLTSAGKILLRGKYLLSRSSGVNRIKGGSVQIN